MDLDKAIKTVIEKCPNPYAVSYAENIELAEQEYGKEGVRVQCLYILSNIVDIDEDTDPEFIWDTDEAKEVIECLRTNSER